MRFSSLSRTNKKVEIVTSSFDTHFNCVIAEKNFQNLKRSKKKNLFSNSVKFFRSSLSLALSTGFFVDALTSAANSLLIKTSKKKSQKKSEGFLTIFSEHRNAQNVQLHSYQRLWNVNSAFSAFKYHPKFALKKLTSSLLNYSY